MKIVVDENMPYATSLFARFGEVISVPGRPFDGSVLTDADALMVRSVTKVNAELLSGTNVKFVGTATAGTDHINTDKFDELGIYATSAAGCNAIAVVEYVFSVLFYFAQKGQFTLTDKTVGIIGVGNVGKILAQRLQALGVKVLLCDPPRARNEGLTVFNEFDYLIEHADILTFHTPLIQGGVDNTYHLFDHQKMSEFADGKMIINASRGEVIDTIALLRSLEQGRLWQIALDVFENEPHINLSLLPYIQIATAHIAGHSLEGKIRGTTLLVEQYYSYLAKHSPLQIESLEKPVSESLLQELLPEPQYQSIYLNEPFSLAIFYRLMNLIYDVQTDDAKFRYTLLTRDAIDLPIEVHHRFDYLRKNYSVRREWSSLNVITSCSETAKKLQALGFKIKYQPNK
ncbi:4-phosphoerythronate dehydrogenase [Thorsellia anophelis]|uniref:Erythronate-4-phosphate dehydrogenase n=1 Tax=Thorsellia anophelis DSM 18579 TaxID=1123402 RepID=A0A1I0DQE4_9GAMM|nr:4-phosphoerythronate dehydrogenase [Thorsellia anophelis]SET34590.1 erythronate-4-phosphate dehydrogenase [Thorsellia anophelis DSM 18579]